MRQFRRTWANQDGDHDNFHFGDFPAYFVSRMSLMARMALTAPPANRVRARDSNLNAAGTDFGRIGPAHSEGSGR